MDDFADDQATLPTAPDTVSHDLAAMPEVPWKTFQGVCAELREWGQKASACEAYDLTYTQVTKAIRLASTSGDAAWQELWDASYEAFTESLERESVKRGRDGWYEDVWHKGEIVGEVKRFDSHHLEIQLKRHKPKEYRTQVQVGGSIDVNHHGSSPIYADGIDLISQLSPEAKRAVRQIIMEDLRKQAADKAAMEASTELINVGGDGAIEGQFSVLSAAGVPHTSSEG